MRTDAPFPSEQLEQYAKNIALAESRLLPTTVTFTGAVVKLATPGATSESLRGQYSNVDLEKLRGQIALSEEDTLAFPAVVAVYAREANWGRHGRLTIPHVLTAAEWNDYAHKRSVPLRFQRPNERERTPFSDELMEAVRPANGTYVMPPPEGVTEQDLCPIRGFCFRGFQVSSVKSKRKKSSAASKRAVARRVALASDEAGEIGVGGVATLSRSTRAKSAAQSAGVVYLLQAGGHYKIGKTINLEKRLTQIKLQLPYAVELLHVIHAANVSQAESHWHRRFAARRRNGEWFELTDAEVQEFKSKPSM